jgi:hypothetical protein
MARGWESKSIEEQLAAAETRSDLPEKKRLTPAEIDCQRQRSLLESSRALVVQQLKTVQNPRYRQLLEAELASLEAQLADISSPEVPQPK